MTPTIHVRENTKQLLDALKSQMNAETYDKVLLFLLQQKAGIFGFAKGKLKPFTKKDEMTFDEL